MLEVALAHVFRFAIEPNPDPTPGEPIPWQDPNVPGGAQFTLPEGTHTLHVEATDVAGNVTTVVHNFTAQDLTPPPPATDQVPPSVVILSPADGATTTGTLSAAFTVSDPSGISAIACSIDGAGAVPCSSPFAMAGLTAGIHTLTVTGTDTFGNSGSASRTWSVSRLNRRALHASHST